MALSIPRSAVWLGALFALTSGGMAQTPPFNQCKAAGLDASCRILILIDTNGSLRVLTDTTLSATYDGSDDTLVGVLNLSGNKIASIPLRGPDQIFGFDGDGICASSITPNPPGCPFGPTEYEGPGVSFSGISADGTSGTVNFNPPLAAGNGSAYFGLEMAIPTQCAGIVPPPALKQDNAAWKDMKLGASNQTIGAYGCALTDLAMEINYYAIRQHVNFSTDPAKLATFIAANNGFDANGNILLNKVPLVTTYAKNNGVIMYFGGLIGKRDDFTLDQYLCHGFPPMLYVGNPHWVLSTGQTTHNGNQTYADLDPDNWPNGDTLDNGAWNNTYGGMLLFSDLVGPLQGLYVTAHSPVHLMLTAPDGSKTGFDPTSNISLNEITNSGYIVNQLANDVNHGPPYTPDLKELVLTGTANGTYMLQATGTASGPFTIEVVTYDSAGNSQSQSFTGTAAIGSITPFTIKYLSAPGAQIVVTQGATVDPSATGPVVLTPQTITFLPIPDHTATDAPFTVSATSSSGLPATISVVNGPATVNGNTVTLNGLGTVTLQGAQAGNDVFAPASATISFNVTLGVPSVASVVNSATFRPGPLTPLSYAAVFGSNLASGSNPGDASQSLKVAGSTVTVKDAAGKTGTAALAFASFRQINFVVPPGLAPGAATLTVTNGAGMSVTAQITIATVAPGVFTADSSGSGSIAADYLLIDSKGTVTFVPAASCNPLRCTPLPLVLPSTGRAYLVFYGTGIRGGSGTAGVKVTIGGTPVTVTYAGAQGSYPALDQVNALLPPSLAGVGTVDLVMTVDGITANVVKVAIQ